MGIKIIAKNRKAFHEYNIFDKFEAGLVLKGTEVKSIRAGKINLTDGWVDFRDDEAFLHNVHISPYTHGNIFNHEERRQRKLLLQKREIIKLLNSVQQKGYSIVPIKVYLKGQLVKVEIALAKGKKLHDKRAASKEKDANKEIARAMRKQVG
ncbi:MAG: SsrA-binding protein SmpB [Bdellovibrionota bacterium]